MAISVARPMDEFTIDFTVQQEWRILILIAFFSGSVGAGAFLLSQYLGFVWGMVAALLVVGVIKTGAHVLYLGRPLRFLRAFAHPQTSWIARGMIGLALFMVFGVLYVLSFFPWFSWLPWTPESPVGQVIRGIATIAGLWLMIYTAFVMAAPPSIPFWNTALLPILFMVYGVMGGMDILLMLLAVPGVPHLESSMLEVAELALISLALVVVLVYLGLMSSGSPAAKRAVRLIVRGDLAPHFLVGVLLAGLLIPLALGLYVYMAAPSAALWLTALEGLLVLFGGLMLRWVVLRAGVYAPVY